MTTKVILDIGGQRFVTSLQSVKSLPNTKLGQLVSKPDSNDVTFEFYFDRNAEIFRFILDYYRTGELHMPSNMCVQMFKKELEFWEISETSLFLCPECGMKYIDESDDEKLEAMKSFTLLEYVPIPPNCQISPWRKNVWLLLDDPSNSNWAKIPAAVYLLISVLSIITTILTTFESMREPLDNSTFAIYSDIEWPSEKLRTKFLTSTRLGYVNGACAMYFVIDCFARFLVCPFKKKFFKSFFNVLDLFIVFPLNILILAGYLIDLKYRLTERYIISFLLLDAVIKVFMVIRLLKFIRHNIGIKVLFLTIKSCLPLFGILMSFMSIATLLYAFLIYTSSIQDDTFFPNVLYGMWWAIVTMTTVGYGDMYPVNALGYIVGVLCTLTGIILTALPIAVLGNSFTTYLQYAKEYKMMKKAKTEGDRSQQVQFVNDKPRHAER